MCEQVFVKTHGEPDSSRAPMQFYFQPGRALGFI